METVKLKKNTLLTLKAKIKGLAAEGQRCHSFIRASEKERRARHWDIKRSIGAEARYHLIAYGLLRGVPYEQIEPNSNKEKMTSFLFNYNYLAQIMQRHCHYSDRGKWIPAALQRLLTTGTMEVPMEKAS